MRILSYLAVSLVLVSCASVNELPKTANEAFSSQSGDIGRTGWSKYEDTMFVRGIDRPTAFLAAKEGLASASFTVSRGNEADGSVVGARGMTAYDWNVVAGVYFQEQNEGFEFAVVAQGSRDWGFWGDQTGSSWPQDILRGIRDYVQTEAAIADPDRDVFSSGPE